MDKIGERSETIKDSVLGVMKFSESVAIKAIESATEVLKAGLDSAEILSNRTSDIMLNKVRRTINSGSTVGTDVRNATKIMVRETVQTVLDIGKELKEFFSTKSSNKPEKLKG